MWKNCATGQCEPYGTSQGSPSEPSGTCQDEPTFELVTFYQVWNLSRLMKCGMGQALPTVELFKVHQLWKLSSVTK